MGLHAALLLCFVAVLCGCRLCSANSLCTAVHFITPKKEAFAKVLINADVQFPVDSGDTFSPRPRLGEVLLVFLVYDREPKVKAKGKPSLKGFRQPQTDNGEVLQSFKNFHWSREQCTYMDEGHRTRLKDYLHGEVIKKVEGTRVKRGIHFPVQDFNAFLDEKFDEEKDLADKRQASQLDISTLRNCLEEYLPASLHPEVLPNLDNPAAARMIPTGWYKKLGGTVFAIIEPTTTIKYPSNVVLLLEFSYLISLLDTNDQGRRLWDIVMTNPDLLPSKMTLVQNWQSKEYHTTYKYIEIMEEGWKELKKKIVYSRVTRMETDNCLVNIEKNPTLFSVDTARYYCVKLIDFYPATLEKLSCNSVEFRHGEKRVFGLPAADIPEYDLGKLISINLSSATSQGGYYMVTKEFLGNHADVEENKKKLEENFIMEFMWELKEYYQPGGKFCTFHAFDPGEYLERLRKRSERSMWDKDGKIHESDNTSRNLGAILLDPVLRSDSLSYHPPTSAGGATKRPDPPRKQTVKFYEPLGSDTKVFHTLELPPVKVYQDYRWKVELMYDNVPANANLQPLVENGVIPNVIMVSRVLSTSAELFKVKPSTELDQEEVKDDEPAETPIMLEDDEEHERAKKLEEKSQRARKTMEQHEQYYNLNNANAKVMENYLLDLSAWPDLMPLLQYLATFPRGSETQSILLEEAKVDTALSVTSSKQGKASLTTTLGQLPSVSGVTMRAKKELQGGQLYFPALAPMQFKQKLKHKKKRWAKRKKKGGKKRKAKRSS